MNAFHQHVETFFLTNKKILIWDQIDVKFDLIKKKITYNEYCQSCWCCDWHKIMDGILKNYKLKCNYKLRQIQFEIDMLNEQLH